VNQISAWLLTIVTAVAGMAAGILLCVWWTRRAARNRRMIPKRWPLSPRVLANTDERKVWLWMCQTFSDHHVMIKLPVTRFTMPRTREHGLHWYNLLSGVYCTFTVCRVDGHVVGCVDVLGRNGLPRNNRKLKQTLLSQFGIAYWVVESSKLPTLAEIRTEFLGETDSTTREREREDAMITAARMKLRDSLHRQRQNRYSDRAPLSSTAGHTFDSGPESQLPADSEVSIFGSGLHQENSFLTPLDSRRGELC
jgi:hypothetical protein